MSSLDRRRAAAGLALAHLRHHRLAATMAVLGVTLAVLSTTLLAAAGAGAVGAGERKYAATGRDLWVSGSTRIEPGSVGGFSTGIQGAHPLAAEIEAHPNVRAAVPMSMRTVYAGTDPDDLRTVFGVGVPGDRLRTRVTDGRYFREGDRHYANGTYDGPRTGEAVIGPRLAERLDVSVGDRIHLGGTVVSARRTRFTVVGITDAFSGFLGAPAVAVHLSELQEVTGGTTLDPATTVAVTVDEPSNVAGVRHDLRRRHPEYAVRTNREQLRASLDRRATVVAAGVVLGCLALGSGLALTANVMVQFVHGQRRSFAAALAQGAGSTVLAMVVWTGVLVGLAGGVLGLALTPVVATGLNVVIEHTTGVAGFLRVPPAVLALGAFVSLGSSLSSAAAAGWRLTTLSPRSHLR